MRKKVLLCRKNWKGAFSFARYCMFREQKGKLFWVHSARPNGSIRHHKESYNFLVNSCGLKKATSIVAFHFMERRLKAPFYDFFRTLRKLSIRFEIFFFDITFSKFGCNVFKVRIQRFQSPYATFSKLGCNVC